jgi:hypothetical protein
MVQREWTAACQQRIPSLRSGPGSLPPGPRDLQARKVTGRATVVVDQCVQIAESGAHVADEFAVAGRHRISGMHWPTPPEPARNCHT